MARQFRALQIGGLDLEFLFAQKSDVVWDYFDVQLLDFDSGYMAQITTVIEEEGDFDLVFVQTPLTERVIELLEVLSTPYNTIIDEAYWVDGAPQETFLTTKYARLIQYEDEKALHDKLLAITFPGQYGDKVSPADVHIHCDHTIEVTHRGNKATWLKGDFGDAFKPIISWKKGLIYDENKVIEVWPEFQTIGAVELEYVFRLVSLNPEEGILKTIVMTEADLQQPLYLKRQPNMAYIAISVRARYEGQVRIGAVHKRLSRMEFGQLLLGGSRFVDENREEFFYYFHPGDFRPPLNVYFSGYREAEGFEAYFLMHQLGAPFLLISDPRIQGGSFYLGSPTYEKGIQTVIQNTLAQLGFDDQACIFSGLSMGSFAALYYGAKLKPKGINVGKPLINIGTVADNMKLLRPNDFETSLDITLSHQVGTTYQANDIQQLNQRFWEVFKNSDMRETSIAVTFMTHDDYDRTAFDDLLSVLSHQNVYMLNKAIPGRHNDDTGTVVTWFMNFYKILLKEQFGRG
ncbi:accessory Sec system protein Asp2 [Staphylococcus lutrae]|uniref:Accessory Sec system protein Asp2 n=1 Tax=Staphylococcus lutrae TaxID=155085 RepID=A0AAC9RU53_9STAP|nr:accessory Sec system protein Asp2 [Staphylococcus lutrae]ARJ50847.1 accessory Sec system protein Asp2 [Staphylococcus lutrae]PNZ39693.1 accessory Sec system protein Asp2 [Staphylococcus lutrae]